MKFVMLEAFVKFYTCNYEKTYIFFPEPLGWPEISKCLVYCVTFIHPTNFGTVQLAIL